MDFCAFNIMKTTERGSTENEVARLQHTLEELERNLTTKKEALKKWVGDCGGQTGGRVSTAVREAAAERYL